MINSALKIATGAILATALFISCGDSPNQKSEYQCPMKCEGVDSTYTNEGSCPVCKMDLKEVS